MNARADLLFELGTEELPPKALLALAEHLRTKMPMLLQQAQLAYGDIEVFATPRRLGLLVNALQTQQHDQLIERKGPAWSAAFDAQGRPTKAAESFAGAFGVSVDQLQRLESEKGSWVVARRSQAGMSAAELAPELLRQALASLPIPKRMRWGSNEYQFIRPVHWIVLMLGKTVLTGEMFGCVYGNTSRGHRFHHPHAILISEPAKYVATLREAKVLVRFEERKALITQQVLDLARQYHAHAALDEALLDEVTGLVEWPVALLGQFDARFLQVPAEALVAAMQGHQRYFHMTGEQAKLLPYFIAIANIESSRPEVVRQGNERVIRPRLADAEFFWRTDCEQSLLSRMESLQQVIFQREIGSMHEKVKRMQALALFFAPKLGVPEKDAVLAVELCKCDLMTSMVYEFPELQGVMGKYYALHEAISPRIADAIEQHYWPRGAKDRLPETPLAQTVALADRLDSLIGLFAIGKAPTGDKDPFGLRRAALGILRILLLQHTSIDLREALQQAARSFHERVKAPDSVTKALEFILERLRAYYADMQIRPDVFEAVLAVAPADIVDFDLRVKAVTEFRALPEAANLIQANKRIVNILRSALKVASAPGVGQAKGGGPDQPESQRTVDLIAALKTQARQQGATEDLQLRTEMLRDPAEKNLFNALQAVQTEVAPLALKGTHTLALQKLARLKQPVDEFFEHVMVMVQDADVRHNRLLLLQTLAELFLRTADLSRLQ